MAAIPGRRERRFTRANVPRHAPAWVDFGRHRSDMHIGAFADCTIPPDR